MVNIQYCKVAKTIDKTPQHSKSNPTQLISTPNIEADNQLISSYKIPSISKPKSTAESSHQLDNSAPNPTQLFGTSNLEADYQFISSSTKVQNTSKPKSTAEASQLDISESTGVTTEVTQAAKQSNTVPTSVSIPQCSNKDSHTNDFPKVKRVKRIINIEEAFDREKIILIDGVNIQ